MLWEKEKLLITSNFSFSHGVFKRLVLQTCKKQGLFGKGLIWPSYLVYYPIWPNFCKLTKWPFNDSRWPKFKLIWNFIKTNILTKFQVNWAITVVSRLPIRYFLIQSCNLVNNTKCPKFSFPCFHEDKHSMQFLRQSSHKCSFLKVPTRYFLNMTKWPKV